MRNFGIVTPGLLYRSGKYIARELSQVVNQYQIKQVVDLRDRLPLLALSTYKKLGVTFRHYPIDEYAPFSKDALSIWDGKTPTLIHCWKGAHRTGVWVALYRMSQGWSKEAAITEMMNCGFGNPGKHQELFRSVSDVCF